jgi:uncharacterized protein YjbI with pentapeptide repeats
MFGEEKKMREISDDELKKILAEHKKWIESNREEGGPADLSDTNLRGRKLKGANLSHGNLLGADLSLVQLQGADLLFTHLEGANIEGANLEGANLSGAFLTGANLRHAQLAGAYLMAAHLDHADLSHAHLAGAILMRVNLQGAILEYTRLQGADLIDAKLQGAKLLGAHLQGTNLLGATMQNANLIEVDLQGGYLRYANLQGVSLIRANLTGADFRSANLDGANVTDVMFDGSKKYKGLNVDGSHGADFFKHGARDQAWLEQYKAKRNTLWKCIVDDFSNISSDYGQSVSRWIIWAVFLILIYANLFFFMGKDHFHFSEHIKAIPPSEGSFSIALYFSVVTFSTLGFGDITAITLGGAWVIITEVLLGYIMLGGLISIFVSLIAHRR